MLIETSKFALFLLLTVLAIRFLHIRFEKIANQFDLDETEPIHHSKNYTNLFKGTGSVQNSCPLYPDKLSKKTTEMCYLLCCCVFLKLRNIKKRHRTNDIKGLKFFSTLMRLASTNFRYFKRTNKINLNKNTYLI